MALVKIALTSPLELKIPKSENKIFYYSWVILP